VTRVLLIDDDEELCSLLQDYLGGEGYEVGVALEGTEGLERAVAEAPALVVLDVMLPGMSGFDVLRELRARSRVPVIMLTARGEEVDRIVGLELGADDYMPKPFNPRELTARIRAVLRRADQAGGAASVTRGSLVVGDVEMDVGARVVRVAGDELTLTGTEFSLLELLLRHAGQVVERMVLSREVLGRRANPFDRSLDVHISNLRRKLGPGPAGADRIKTLRGVGYQYVRSAAEGQTP